MDNKPRRSAEWWLTKFPTYAGLAIGYVAVISYLFYQRGFHSRLTWIVAVLLFALLACGLRLTLGSPLSSVENNPEEKNPAEKIRSSKMITVGGVSALAGFLILPAKPGISLRTDGVLWLALGFGLMLKKSWCRQGFIALAAIHSLAIIFMILSGAIRTTELLTESILFLLFLSWGSYALTRPVPLSTSRP